MRRRLLLYAHDWAPSVGGVQTQTMDLARGISEWSKTHPEDAWEVTLVTQTPPGGMDDSALSFRVIRRPSILQLIGLVRSSHVLHIAGPCLLPMTSAYCGRKPFVVEHHGYQAICPNGMLLFGKDHTLCPGHFKAGRYSMCFQCNRTRVGWGNSLRTLALNFPRNWLCKRAAANVAISDHVGKRIDLPRTHTTLYGIQVPRGTTSDSRNSGKPLQFTSGKPLQITSGMPLQITYVGRLVVEKGVSILLDAANELKKMQIPFRLSVIGDGPERHKLERQVQSAGLADCISFYGYLTGRSLDEAVRSARVLVMPSRCEETAGLAAIEHMMRGGVVVAARIGGLAEVVGDGGITFEPMDPIALAQSLRRIAEDPDWADQISARGRIRALKLFSVEKMVVEHLEAYQKVLDCW